MSSGTLFVVATPIGNLEDLTLRAVRVLREVDTVAAEDTRRSRGLLSHLGIGDKRLVSLDAHASEEKIAALADAIASGESVALLTDAGTPVVSDPGDALVRAAIARGLTIVPLPGASAVLTALVGSGFAGPFRFVGFIARDGTARSEALGRIAGTPEIAILFESPNRTQGTLAELAQLTPTRAACVARELTKMHEEFVRGSLAELAESPREWIGEVTIVLGPFARDEAAIDDAAVDARIDEELARGGHAKSIAERIAAWSGRSKRDVYERVIARKPRG